MLESIEKLRDRYYKPGYKGEPTLEQIAGAIEREIAERYMPLPPDADGVPWTRDDDAFVDELGDVYMLRRLAWNPGVKQWYLLDQDNKSFLAKECRHVKERTVEDVLREMVGMTDQPLCEEDIQAFADEIRCLGHESIKAEEKALYEKRMRGDWS